MIVDREMQKAIYKMLLKRGWTIEELFEDVQTFCIEGFKNNDDDEAWADKFCDVLERYKR